MIKKLLIAGLLFLGSGMYGMEREKRIQRDPGAYLHSTVAHDYTGVVAEQNKHYFRLQKLRLMELLEEGNGTSFRSHLAPHFANKEHQRWKDWVQYVEERKKAHKTS